LPDNEKTPLELNEMRSWILHLQHPLVLMGLGLLICTFIIWLLGRRRFGGKTEWLLIRGTVILPLIALLAVIAGLVMSWKNLAISLNSQAVLCYQQGNYEEAERLYKESIESAEKIFGEDNISVATVLNNLSELYQEQKRYSEAEIVLDRAFKIIEKEGDLYYQFNCFGKRYAR
jgi:tetratricopeptide (TPR) repeat protein